MNVLEPPTVCHPVSPTPAPGIVPPPAVIPYVLDAARPLPVSEFPVPPAKSGLLPVIPNVEHLLKMYGITVRYNVIKKKLVITVPGHSGSSENFDGVAMTQILSLATLNGMPTGQIPAIVDALGDRNLFNPVADWIHCRPWDGQDRLEDFYGTLVTREGFPAELKKTLMRKWLLSAVAAALSTGGFRCRGVLTLQGPQGIGKTAWVKSLISDAALSQSVIKLDHHLDAGNKDSLLSAITHWFVEMGELDGSLRKDVARLKGFLTADQDKVRRPYGRVDSEYGRRTVFCATVNDANFLVDTTGNTRWWTIPVTHIDSAHGIDMQQLFAQLTTDYHSGGKWWLTDREERQLDEQNLAHRSVSALKERLLDAIDLDRIDDELPKPLTPTEVLQKLQIDRPSNQQAKECGSILREVLGSPRRIQGRDKWRVPFREVRDEDVVL